MNGNSNIRDLNKSIKWDIPSKGAKTINGLILEHLGDIPNQGKHLEIEDYFFEVIDCDSNHIHSVRVTNKN